MSGFEPPANRKSYSDSSGFMSPARVQQEKRPPIKHFSSGISNQGLPTPPASTPPAPASTGGTSSFFGLGFRKRSTPAVSTASSSETAHSPNFSSGPPPSSSSYSSLHQSGEYNPSTPPQPRRLSSKELKPVGGGNRMSSNSSSAHEVMLVDPYSLPRDNSPRAQTAPNPNQQQPSPPRSNHTNTASTSSAMSIASTDTTRPNPRSALHPEIRSLVALNTARKITCFSIFPVTNYVPRCPKDIFFWSFDSL